jgi:hypothetical protein
MTEYMDRPRLIAVWALEGYRLALTFANNQESIVDLSGDVRRVRVDGLTFITVPLSSRCHTAC